MSETAPLHLAVALDGAGWHPAAWRAPDARADELFTPGYWLDLVQEAERGLLDFVTIEDSVGLQPARYDATEPGEAPGRVRGRLDAVLVAARVAPLTRHVGLVPTVTVTHSEPFHASKAIATLDYVSSGRAGVRVQVSARPYEAALFGRREFPAFRFEDRAEPAVAGLITDLFDEAADYVEVVRRLWDSWEDDAVIRDAATGRFVDRDRLHYIDFTGRWFSVKGPSITPRPPQGQPPVTALAHATEPYRLAARSADVVYVTPSDAEQVRTVAREVRREESAAGREGAPLHVFGDLVVFLGATPDRARAHRDRLDALAGEEFASDAHVFTGTPAELVDLLLEWQAAGLSGFRLRPAALPSDLLALTREVVPELRRRGAFRGAYEARTLRGLLGLARPANRYATTSA